jgi:hypothetical protein
MNKIILTIIILSSIYVNVASAANGDSCSVKTLVVYKHCDVFSKKITTIIDVANISDGIEYKGRCLFAGDTPIIEDANIWVCRTP